MAQCWLTKDVKNNRCSTQDLHEKLVNYFNAIIIFWYLAIVFADNYIDYIQ